MKMKIEFSLDGDTFGGNHHDPQFGYAIQTALNRVAKSYAGASRFEVGTGKHDGHRLIHDSNGSELGTVVVEGYEPPKLTRDEKVQKFFEDHTNAECIDALAEMLPDLKVPMRYILNNPALAAFITASRVSDEDIDALIAHYN